MAIAVAVSVSTVVSITRSFEAARSSIAASSRLR